MDVQLQCCSSSQGNPSQVNERGEGGERCVCVRPRPMSLVILAMWGGTTTAG